MKKWVQVATLVFVVGAFQGIVLAQAEAPPAGETKAAPARPLKPGIPLANAVAIVGACLGAGLSAVGGGYGISRIGAQCIDAIARQPEAAGAVFAPMIVTAAMVEGGMLFAIVICLLGLLGI